MEKKCVALKWHQNVQKPFKLLRHMCIKMLVFEFQLCKRYVTFKVHM